MINLVNCFIGWKNNRFDICEQHFWRLFSEYWKEASPTLVKMLMVDSEKHCKLQKNLNYFWRIVKIDRLLYQSEKKENYFFFFFGWIRQIPKLGILSASIALLALQIIVVVASQRPGIFQTFSRKSTVLPRLVRMRTIKLLSFLIKNPLILSNFLRFFAFLSREILIWNSYYDTNKVSLATQKHSNN